MILTKILFICLIFICIAFYILYLWDFAFVLMIIMIALPIIMFVTTYMTKRMMKIDFAVKDKLVPKNQSFPVQLCITNRSIFPIGKAEAHIEYYNVFNNQITNFELHLPIQPMNSQRVTFQLTSRFCGIIKIRTSYISLYDPLRLFRFKTGKNIHTEIAVIPEGHEIGGTVNYTDRINEESNTFSEYRPGDDPSEVFDLREYVPGDKINRIHWKLSSKKDEFIVKEYSLPVDVPCSLFLNLKCYEDNDYTLPVFDTLVETLISISQFLIENERVHSIIYFSAKERRFVERDITGPEKLTAAVHELIMSVNDNLYCDPPDLFFAENQSLSLSSFTFITSVPDTPVLEYIDENVDADIKNAVVVVKSPEESAALEAGYSSMNTFPVVIGRISSSIKDIEL